MGLDECTHLSDFLHALAAAHPEGLALAGERNALTFAGLDAAADAWAQRLRQRGCRRATHVGLLAGNSPDWLAAAFGVWRAGATLVPISTFVTPRELFEVLDHADVELLLLQSQLRSHDYRAALTELPALPQLHEVLELDQGAARLQQQSAQSSASCDADDIACVLYTSGTTGRAKGVMLSHRAILATVLPTARRGGLDASDTLLSSLPLFWVAGLVIRALPTLASAATLVLMESFSADAAIVALRRHRPTALHLRPPQVGQILGHRDFAADLLAKVRKGGGRSAWYAPHLAGARLITGYGMTEMAGYVTCLDWQDDEAVRQVALGTCLPGVEIRVVDSDGGACATAENGEILVRGPGLFSGYYKEKPGTGLDATGWFMTGDLGNLDFDGMLIFAGRSKDLLRVKGINVSPLEVEAVLALHPAVEAAYVVGLPADGLDQQVVAVIVAKAATDCEGELRALAQRELSHYKRPAAYVFVERSEIPLGGTSKPQRAALAEIAARRPVRRHA